MLKARPQNTPTSNQITLKSSSCTTSIYKSLCKLSITQTFLNSSSSQLECDYSFPFSPDSLISNFEVILEDGSVLKGILKDKDSVQEEYQDSISSGNTGIITNLSPDRNFSVIIGNLSPNESLSVKIELTLELSCDSDNWKLSVPSSIFPTSPSTSLNFEVRIFSPSIQSYSSNLPLHWSSDESLSEVVGTLNPEPFILENEAWVKYRDDLSTKPSCLIQSVEGRYFGMISFIPYCQDTQSIQDVEGLGEFVFLLDRSGSMAGSKIETAKQSLLFFLKSLPLNSFFNIVSFGSTFEFMFKKPRKSDSTNLDYAIKAVQQFSADLGGTEMFDPLNAVYSQKQQEKHLRVVFLLTDGQVANTEQVLDLIQKNACNSLLHSFGIGASVRNDFIEMTAKLGQGSSFIISDNDQICRSVIRALKQSIIPCVSEWKVSVQGEAFPRVESVGSVLYGKRFAQFVKMDSLPNKAVCLEYFDSFLKDTVQVVINDFPIVPGFEIARLWNKYKLEELLKNPEKNKNEILSISIQSGIPTVFTSFLCVKENDGKVVSEIVGVNFNQNALRIQNRVYNLQCLNASASRMTKTSGVYLNREYRSAARSSACCSTGGGSDHQISRSQGINSSFMHNPSLPTILNQSISFKENLNQVDPKSSIESLPIIRINEPPVINPEKTESKYLKMIKKQHPEGFWKFSEIIEDFPELLNIEKQAGVSENLEILTTVFILTNLLNYHSNQHEEWELLERKALKWLRSNSVEFTELQENLKKFLSL